VYKIIAVCALVFLLLYSLIKKGLYYKSLTNPIPDCVSKLYDEEKYNKWLNYQHESVRLGFFYLINSIVLIILIGFDFFSFVSNAVGGNDYLNSLIIVLLFGAVNLIVNFPIDYIGNMKIETKYGFNKKNNNIFISDTIKQLIISFVLVYGLVCLYILFQSLVGNYVVIIMFAVAMLLIVLLSAFMPYLMLIFNKKTPLEEGTLRTKLSKLLLDNGYKVKDIYVMDGSKRSTRANAFFAGMGKTKSIVLYDTIIDLLTEDELVAVFAHELGHGVHKDISRNLILSSINFIIIIGMIFLFTTYYSIGADFGFQSSNTAFSAIITLMTIVAIFGIPQGIVTNYLSRKAEYKADAYSAKLGHGDALISGLKKLSADSFAHLSPSKFDVITNYSHPPVAERIQNIQKHIK
jgi:STE24 endopeptidase